LIEFGNNSIYIEDNKKVKKLIPALETHRDDGDFMI